MYTPNCPLPAADTGCGVLEARCCRPTLVHRGGPVYCHCPPFGVVLCCVAVLRGTAGGGLAVLSLPIRCQLRLGLGR